MPTTVTNDRMKVQQKGVDLYVRIPRTLAASKSIVKGSYVTVEPCANGAARTRRRSRFRLKDLLGSGVARGGEVDIGPPVGKEII